MQNAYVNSPTGQINWEDTYPILYMKLKLRKIM